MKRLVTGIFAHVDSGKTTLSEAILYNCGEIRSLGRVDHNIRFRFITCGRLRQQFINDNIRSFNLLTTTVRNQLDEEHWSIRTGNLLQIADAVGIEIK
ncbi:MAG: hypothetical protein IKL31_10400 [Ruminococcus sp.]|nr:hypothetical protein [Ruminococcus sp.]